MHEMLYRTRPLEPKDIMDRPIEERFTINGRTFECCKAPDDVPNCILCSFDFSPHGPWYRMCRTHLCSKLNRDDKKNVYFKEVGRE